MSVRSPYATRLKNNKTDIRRYTKAAKDLQAQSARSDLVGGGSKRFAGTSDDPYGERSDRMRLLAGTETLDDGTRRIQDSQRIALETEDVGADTLRELRRQREQIENATDTVSSLVLVSWAIDQFMYSFTLPIPPLTVPAVPSRK